MKQVMIVDGNNFFTRGYHSAKYSNKNISEFILDMYCNLIERNKEARIIFAYDTTKSQRRLELYPEYKANRKSKMTEEEYAEFGRLLNIFINITRYNGHSILDGDGYEADDYIACISQMLKNRYDVVIVTTDGDLLQLVDKYIRVYDPIKGLYITLDNFFNVMEVKPESFLDYKCIRGDDSDNIPGIDLFGKITTKKFLNEYGSYENIFNEMSKKTKRLKKEESILNREVYERNKKLMDLSLYFSDDNLKRIIKERVALTSKDDQKLHDLLANNDLSHYFKRIR